MKKIVLFYTLTLIIIVANLLMPMSTSAIISIPLFILLLGVPIYTIYISYKYLKEKKKMVLYIFIGVIIFLMLVTFFLLFPSVGR